MSFNRIKLPLLFSAILALVMCCLAGCDGGGDGGGVGDARQYPCSACESGEYTRAVSREATILEDGEAKYICNRCADSYTEAIPATKSIKLLVVGDASSSDCIRHLEPMLRDIGVENTVIYQLNYSSGYSTGVTLDKQWDNIENNRAVYTVNYSVNGESDKDYTRTFLDGLQAHKWDYIVLQQSVGMAGIGESYSHLGDIIDFIDANKTNPQAKILWNMTWAFGIGSTNSEFCQYAEDQILMYNEIIKAVGESILTDSRIYGIIPTGTAVQNMRGAYTSSELTGRDIKLEGATNSYALYLAALTWCRALTGVEIDEIEWTPVINSSYDKNILKLAKEAAAMADSNKYETNSPKVKSIKLLIFGNSYGNDATAYLTSLLYDGGYTNVTIGHAGESSMAINDHYHNIDDDPDNDYIYTTSSGVSYTFSVHYKTVNGERVELPADYKQIVADEPWDYIIFYQGPNSAATLTEERYYSELDNFVTALKANMTNPEGKIVYYMTWAHNVTDTASLYNGICDITERLIVTNENIAGVIPAATLIQNLRTSYLKDGAAGDITRDWGHLNYGVGRYAMGLLFYSYLTGESIDSVSYIPTEADVSVGERPLFTDPGENIEVIREAVSNALRTPYDLTESVYKEKP